MSQPPAPSRTRPTTAAPQAAPPSDLEATPPPTTPDAPLVAIGASAGGLDALVEFFQQVREDSGASFVLIQHLSPDFESMMDHLLARHTAMAVRQIENGDLPAPNTIHLIPPAKILTLDYGAFRLTDQDRDRGPNYPINEFFRSAAAQLGSEVIGIVLSGSGTDGSQGALAIKERAGLVLVQDPSTAQFDGMPRATISCGAPDVVLPPRELAEQLNALLEKPRRLIPSGAATEDMFADILRVLRDRTGLDLSEYKRKTLLRRIERRMAVLSVLSLEAYRDLLQSDETEVEHLRRSVFIGVTEFFRDPDAWAFIRQEIVPKLVEEARERSQLRLWVAGCALGEEAYSLAMLIEEYLDGVGADLDYTIFATDLDASTVARATEGYFPDSIEAVIEPARLARHFRREGNGFRVTPALRRRIIFAVHDVGSDPPFTRIDMASCRNLLIYFQPQLQEKALALLHFALRPGGILFLGASETTTGVDDEFETLNRPWKIYEKVVHDTRGPNEAKRLVSVPSMRRRSRGVPAPRVDRFDPTQERQRVLESVLEHLVDDHSEALMVLTQDLKVAHVFGNSERFLRPPSGRVSFDLATVVRESLSGPLRTLARQAHRTGEPSRAEAIPLDVPASEGDPVEVVDLRVVPVVRRDAATHLVALIGNPRPFEGTLTAVAHSDLAKRRIEELEREVLDKHERLLHTVEELESLNEELQAANEELLSSNEELQSTNEELHSVNEELYTVNAEHQQKIEELVELHSDVENLLHGSAVGTMFLDADLTIRKFTPAVNHAIAVRDHDVGRPFRDLAHKLEGEDLQSLVDNVLHKGEQVEREVATADGRSLLMRLHPYDSDGGHNGVVLTFVDVSDLVKTRSALEESEARFRSITESSRDVFWIADAESLEMVYVSPRYKEVWGQSLATLEIDGRQWLQAIHPDDRMEVEQRLIPPWRDDGPILYRVLRPDGEIRWVRHRRLDTLSDAEAGQVGGVIEDVTAETEARTAQHQANQLFRSAFDHSRVGMAVLTSSGEFVRANRGTLDLLGLSPGNLPTDLISLSTPEHRTGLKRALNRLSTGGRSYVEHEFELETAGDQRRVIEVCASAIHGGGTDGPAIVCHLLDVTHTHDSREELQAIARDLEAQAHRDPLTSLLNRRGLEKELATRLGGGRESSAAAILIDCDNFKDINDEHGHHAGDVVLQTVARRIWSVLRPSDLSARVGGDEFVVVLPNTRVGEGLHVAEKLRRSIGGEPATTDHGPISVTVSLGVAAVPSVDASIEGVLAACKDALRSSKQAGKDRVHYRDGDTTESQGGVVDILEGILKGDDVHAVAQEIRNLHSGEVWGFELLSRGPDGAFAQPADLFAACREHAMLERADVLCLSRTLGASRGLGEAHNLHFNVFPSTLLGEDFPRIEALVKESTWTDRLCLEISEQQFVGDPGRLLEAVKRLRELGTRIALDDVGFGRSSLETLIMLAPDVVKIDRTLVTGVSEDAGRRRSLDRLIHIADSLSVDLIAEGIETESDRDTVIEMGVGLGQGFLFGKPAAVT